MLLLRTLAPWLLFAFLAQQVSLSSGAREKGRKGKAEDRGAEQTGSAAPGRAQRGGKAAATRGKFSTKDKMQCTWAAREDGETVNIKVDCENREARITGGVTELSCEYNAKPQVCPGYVSNPAGFWKQVSRALKKLQMKLCMDDRALLKAGMCKRAPRDAHFKLDIGTAVASAQQPGDDMMRQLETPRTRATTTTTTTATAETSDKPITGSSCTERVDQRKLSEEYCSSSWASVCSFFFAMLQSGDC
uniref:fibroblast growth factor-binding protein 1-like n=1 Tax=Centroberyx gerrardi TaxID=166262 RepID=UPI003AADAF9C